MIAIPPGLSGVLNQGPPSEPRPAASVLVVRGRASWELLMMRRPGGADFAPGAYVFPGGTVHADDDGVGDVHRAAAVRELFEELGVLLARRPGGRFARDADAGRLRALLAAGLSWPAALAAVGLSPATDRLAFLARWITPEAVRRRFDTHFFVCRLPAGQTEHPQAGEVADWTWVTPAGALAELDLVFPTRRVLEAVAGEADASALIRKLRRRRPGAVVMPRVERDGDGFRPVVEYYHPDTLERLPGPLVRRQRQASRQRS